MEGIVLRIMETAKFTGVSAAILGVAAFLPEAFTAFTLSSFEVQFVLGVVAIGNALIMQFLRK
jgi:hypothetical protein